MNTKKPIDWTKPVQTSEDPPRPLRVLCTDRADDFRPVVCTGINDGALFTFRLDGRFLLSDDPACFDAQNVPEPEQPKDPYAHLREALAEGKVIQFTFGGRGWHDTESPSFKPPPENYRIKPEAKRVPLERADVPLGSTILLRDEEWLVIGVTRSQVSLGGDGYSFSDLMRFDAKIQRPGSSTFEPCYKEVEE